MQFLFFIPFIIFAVVVVTIIVIAIKNQKNILDKNWGLGDDEFVKNLKDSVGKTLNPDKYKRYCEYCGTEIKDDETKCSSCGATVTKKDK